MLLIAIIVSVLLNIFLIFIIKDMQSQIQYYKSEEESLTVRYKYVSSKISSYTTQTVILYTDTQTAGIQEERVPYDWDTSMCKIHIKSKNTFESLQN